MIANFLRPRAPAWAATALQACAGAVFGQVSFTNLGVLPGWEASVARAVSADGSVVAGYNYEFSTGNSRAFRWTRAAGMQDLGALPGGNRSFAYGVNGDGSVIVGFSDGSTFANTRAFRWTSAGGMQDLGTLPGGNRSFAYGVDGDGSVVVGYSSAPFGSTPPAHAFRWTSAGGMQDLGVRPGATESFAYGVSADGSVVVGGSHTPALAGHYPASTYAFRWTSSGGMQDLGVLPNVQFSSGLGVSGDGAVVVGTFSYSSGYSHAFRWTSATGMVDLVAVGGDDARSNSASGDGSAVVGMGAYRAILWTPPWTPPRGMVDLTTYLPMLGVNLAGWTLSEATGISADGSVIVGYGPFNGAARGWIVSGVPASCYANCDGSTTQPCLNMLDFTCFLSKFGAGDSSANCDHSATTPVLNILDFVCFLNRFAAGCSGC